MMQQIKNDSKSFQPLLIKHGKFKFTPEHSISPRCHQPNILQRKILYIYKYLKACRQRLGHTFTSLPVRYIFLFDYDSWIISHVTVSFTKQRIPESNNNTLRHIPPVYTRHAILQGQVMLTVYRHVSYCCSGNEDS